jgi:ATP-independent RNA helicase DbpA
MASDFRSLSLAPGLLEVVEELGFATLTPIQARAIPVLLEGHDLVGQSKTGSGKTAAFALPILSKLKLADRASQALVLCPTRELCAQVAREVRKLGRRQAGLRVLELAGGAPIRAQSRALERGAHVLVGTPGRVLDHLKRATLVLGALETLVLDEADRMLEMGFQDDVEQIIAATPASRQTVFFSATFPSSIEAMSRRHQRQPQRVTVTDEIEEELDIRQSVVFTAAEDKLATLRWVLAQHPHDAALVFANLKATVAQLAQDLAAEGLSVAALHGDLEQPDRDRVLAKFRNGSTRTLIATDVAARGIDVANLDLVVNFDLPSRPEIYVHRIGRTGRAGRSGLAISLAISRERDRISLIEQVTGVRLERIERRSGAAKKQSAPNPELGAKMVTLRISGGRRQKVRPADILGALTGEAGGLAGTDIGKIEIHDDFSYVAVSRSVSKAALEGLTSGRIKGKKFQVVFAK